MIGELRALAPRVGWQTSDCPDCPNPNPIRIAVRAIRTKLILRARRSLDICVSLSRLNLSEGDEQRTEQSSGKDVY